MPRLTFEKGSGNLTWALSNMGLADLFKPGFSQLYDVSDYKWISVSDIMHKTYLDIRENTVTTTTTTTAPNVNRPSPVEREVVHSPFSRGNPYPTEPQFKSPTVVPSTSAPTSSSNDRNVVNVNLDKPFVYFVIDSISGLVMVMGKYGYEPVNYRLPV